MPARAPVLTSAVKCDKLNHSNKDSIERFSTTGELLRPVVLDSPSNFTIGVTTEQQHHRQKRLRLESQLNFRGDDALESPTLETLC